MGSKTFLLLLVAVLLISSTVISARDLPETSTRNKDGEEEADDQPSRYSTHGGPWGGYGGQWGGYGGPWGGYGGGGWGGYGGRWGGYGGRWGGYGGRWGGYGGRGWCRYGRCAHGEKAVQPETEAEPRD